MLKLDQVWAEYERNYVLELMVIENDARRHILEAIDLERALQAQEQNILKNAVSSIDPLPMLVTKIGKINQIANSQTGQGRDDLTSDVIH